MKIYQHIKLQNCQNYNNMWDLFKINDKSIKMTSLYSSIWWNFTNCCNAFTAAASGHVLIVGMLLQVDASII